MTAPTPLAGATGADGISADLQDPLCTTSPIALQSSLRPYQLNAIARIEAARAAGKRRILCCAPTGSGKTVIASSLITTERARGRRVLFLCHRRELVRQARRKLFEARIDAGTIAAGFSPRPSEPVQIASIQTLHVRAMRTAEIELPPAVMVIVDECHHARAETWQAILDAYPEAVIIGLTATPCRGDDRGLGNMFDELIEVASVRELIDQVTLSRPGFMRRCDPT